MLRSCGGRRSLRASPPRPALLQGLWIRQGLRTSHSVDAARVAALDSDEWGLFGKNRLRPDGRTPGRTAPLTGSGTRKRGIARPVTGRNHHKTSSPGQRAIRNASTACAVLPRRRVTGSAELHGKPNTCTSPRRASQVRASHCKSRASRPTLYIVFTGNAQLSAIALNNLRTCRTALRWPDAVSRASLERALRSARSSAMFGLVSHAKRAGEKRDVRNFAQWGVQDHV